MKRRILCLLLSVCLLLPLLPRLAPTAQAAPSSGKILALTFDDGPGKDTARLLDALRARGVQCSFFIVGGSVSRYSDVVKQCYEDGHQICSHSFSHPMLSGLSNAQIRSELDRTKAALDQAIGCTNTYMVRPPYGDYNDRVLSVLGVPAFYWSDDSGDWRSTDANFVYNNVISGAQDGDILLLHDSHSWSVDAAIRVVDTLLSRGFEFVTLSELFRRRGVALNSGEIYRYCRDNGTTLPALSMPTLSKTVTDDGVLVTLSVKDGTAIHYTTDGTIPNSASKVYTQPFLLKHSAVVNAVSGYDMNGSRSKLLHTQVSVNACQPPELEISSSGSLRISSPWEVHYTTDGTLPTRESPIWTKPVLLMPGHTVSAVAYSNQKDICSSEPAVLRYTERANVFSDVFPGAWYYDSVDFSAQKALLVGTGKYSFSPRTAVTRAMLVTVLYRLAKEPKLLSTERFPDVPEGEWYAKAVCWAKQEGIASGYSDGKFHPTDPITREQTAAILYRYSHNCGYETAADGNVNEYADAKSISAYATDALRWAVANQLYCGNSRNELCPRNSASRAELAAILQRYLKAEEQWNGTRLTDAQLQALGMTVAQLMKAKDFAALNAYVHPELGVSFTPYSTVVETDRKITDLFKSAADATKLEWGSWDGSGEPIEMSFSEYWDRFVWNCDYSCGKTAVNSILCNGNSIENVDTAYADCLYVDFLVESASGSTDAFDWNALKLVFKKAGEKWYLVGIIHSEATM